MWEGQPFAWFLLTCEVPSLDVRSYSECIVGEVRFHMIDHDFWHTTPFLLHWQPKNNCIWDVPKVDDVEDQQLNVLEIIFGYLMTDHIEDDTTTRKLEILDACRIDILDNFKNCQVTWKSVNNKEEWKNPKILFFFVLNTWQVKSVKINLII